MNKFNLSFDDLSLENKCREDFYMSSQNFIKVSTVLGGFLYLAFSLLDYIFYPEFFHYFLGIRVTAASIFVLVYFYLQFAKQSEKSLNLVILLMVLVAGTGLALMLNQPIEEIHYRYLPGMLLVMLFNMCFLRHRFVSTVFTQTILILLTYWAYSTKSEINPVDFIDMTFYVTGFTFVGLVNSYLQELVFRKNFLYRKMIEDQSADIAKKNEKLNQINQEKEELFKWVVHDLRGPLTVVTASMTIIRKKTEGLDLGLDSKIEKAIKNAKRINSMVSSLLETSAVESGHIHLKMEQVFINELLEQTIEEQKIIADNKDIDIAFAQEAFFEGQLDVNKTKEIFENLISNAVKYSPHGTTILIRIGELNSRCLVEVIDQGEGISSQETSLLFTKFGRTTNQPTAGEHSSGLGLYIAKKVVHLMGGEIGYRQNEDKGSTFWVQLPAKEREQKKPLSLHHA